MLSSPDVNPGDEVVNRYGQIGKVIAWVPTHGELAVLTDGEPSAQLWDEWALHQDEVKKVYSEAVEHLVNTRNGLEKEVTGLRVTQEILQLEIANMKAHLEKLQANPITAQALKLAETGVKWVVNDSGEVSAYEGVSRHDKGHRLLWMQLAPPKRGRVYEWMLNAYSDGSGSDTRVYPFADRAEALEFARGIMAERLLAEAAKIMAEAQELSQKSFPGQPGPAKGIPSESHNSYKLEQWEKAAGKAITYGVEVPDEYSDAVNTYRLEAARLSAEKSAHEAKQLQERYLALKGGDA